MHAAQKRNVRLLEVSKAKNSPFGILSALVIGGLMQLAKGEQISTQSLASLLLAGQMQKTAQQNGFSQSGAAMAVMPDIRVSNAGCAFGYRNYGSADWLSVQSCLTTGEKLTLVN